MPRAVRTRKMEQWRDAAFRALADATRRRILLILGPGERRVTDVAREFSMSRPAISKHLAVLKRAGLVSVRRKGRENLYRISSAELRDAAGYVLDVQEFWRGGLQRLDQRLRRRRD